VPQVHPGPLGRVAGAASRTVSLLVSGTPSAVVVEDLKLERMSLRTIPESSSTLGPFDPSPGKGPAVSSGTSARSPPADEEEVVAPEPEPVPPAEPPDPDPPQAASSAAALSPPNGPSTLRRSTSVCKS
jgi:hypothetical protein